MAGNSHGHTPAAWTGVTIAFVGFCISGVFMVLAQPIGFVAGLVVTAAGGVVGWLMSAAGLGQPKRKPGAGRGSRRGRRPDRPRPVTRGAGPCRCPGSPRPPAPSRPSVPPSRTSGPSTPTGPATTRSARCCTSPGSTAPAAAACAAPTRSHTATWSPRWARTRSRWPATRPSPSSGLWVARALPRPGPVTVPLRPVHWWVLGGLALAFTVVRNLPFGAALAP